jgi:Zn finger protein HypA/HybF involved in hydrogenase expression
MYAEIPDLGIICDNCIDEFGDDNCDYVWCPTCHKSLSVDEIITVYTIEL